MNGDEIHGEIAEKGCDDIRVEVCPRTFVGLGTIGGTVHAAEWRAPADICWILIESEDIWVTMVGSKTWVP